MLKINSAKKLETYIRRYPELKFESVEKFIFKSPNLDKKIDLSKLQHSISKETNKNVLAPSIVPENCSLRKIEDNKYMLYTKCMQNGEIIFFLDNNLELLNDLKVIVNKDRKKISYVFKDKSLVEYLNEQKIVKNINFGNDYILLTEINNLKNFSKEISLKYESNDYYIYITKNENKTEVSIKKANDKYDYEFNLKTIFDNKTKDFFTIYFKNEEQTIAYDKNEGFNFSKNDNYYNEKNEDLKIKNIIDIDKEMDFFLLLNDINYKKTWEKFNDLFLYIEKKLENLNNDEEIIIETIKNLKKIDQKELKINNKMR